MLETNDDKWRLRIGANVEGDGVCFRVWAPAAERVEVVLYDGDERIHALRPEGEGYHAGVVPGVGAGTRYKYRLDGGDPLPDPASRYQPEGVHGPSEVVDPGAFRWSAVEHPRVAADDLVVYELHVGTFTPQGTFDSAIDRLDAVAALGATAIEVMPVANFAGCRNWGYDGVNLYAPATAYGDPDGFKRLVEAAHRRGLGVILDVVYNHFGPEGNYLPAITGGRFFTDRHRTPWGEGINYDGPDSGPVRDFVVQNALYWAHEYDVDGLRLDATHAIIDDSPTHILREIAARLHALPRPRVVIAEDERNERRVVLPPDEGGYGLDGVWADDLHHQARRLAAGDREGYFASYGGTADELARTLEHGWFFEGQWSAHQGAPRGTPAAGLPPRAFVHCIQNHDQVGNRPMGDRLNHVVPLPVYRALSALLLVSPYTPLIFMGQEWAASTPFQYFTDHPEELGRLVTQGRREEFSYFPAFADPAARERIPDPQAEETFLRSKLRWDEMDRPPHRGVRELYRVLLWMRRNDPAFQSRCRTQFDVTALGETALALRRRAPEGDGALLVANFAGALRVVLDERPATRAREGSAWNLVLATEEARFGGGGEWGRLAPTGVLELGGPGAVLLRT